MATGIRDKVAILGMGCSKFGERWDVGAEELMVEAFEECLADAGIEKKQIDAAWFGSCLEEINVGKTAMPLSTTLRLPIIFMGSRDRRHLTDRWSIIVNSPLKNPFTVIFCDPGRSRGSLDGGRRARLPLRLGPARDGDRHRGDRRRAVRRDRVHPSTEGLTWPSRTSPP